MSPDFLTRASIRNIDNWASPNGFVEVDLNSTRWSKFADCVPRLPWVGNLEPSPPDIILSPLPFIGEFRPASGTFINCGLVAHVDIQPCQVDNSSTFNIIFAQAQSISEISFIRSLLSPRNHIQVCVVSPSEVTEEGESAQAYWQQRWWLDSCQFGDVLAGTWNVWTHFDQPITIPSYRAASSCLRTLYMEYDFNISSPSVPTRRRPLGHSVGVEISAPHYLGIVYV